MVEVDCDVKRVFRLCHMWSSEGRHVGDAWAHGGEEGRGKLREARGSGTHAVIPRWPNGATRRVARPVITGNSEANPGN